MKIELPKRFLLVDDDMINNLIIKHLLKTSVSSTIEIISFNEPVKALEFITNYKFYKEEIETVLFLDLNMPVLNGWDFLEQFDKLEKDISNQFIIFILSSSLDNRDIARAKAIPSVKDYLVKPLTPIIFSNLFKLDA